MTTVNCMCEDLHYPLGAFSRFVVNDLPPLNKTGSPADLLRLGISLLPDDNQQLIDFVYHRPYNEKVLAMGDLGIFLVSCLKRGILASELRRVYSILDLFSLATGLIPRDTYASYIAYNPADSLRTFTGDASEVAFITRHQQSELALKPAVEELLKLQFEPYMPERLDILSAVRAAMRQVRKENAEVHKGVDPVFFITFFRDYFFPIEVNGTSYNAPSGVHIAGVILTDLITGTADDAYIETTHDLLPYLEPCEQFRIKNAMAAPSLKQIYSADLKSGRDSSSELNLLVDIYDEIVKFRNVHQGLVSRYIRNQDASVARGTGGFAFDTFLQERIDVVAQAKRTVSDEIEPRR
ncbi:monodechloroaminopyrrolnitrin synthase PrnB family protein [Paenibacillus apiarius]|uniref:DUF1864 family protein n=1 Tax=Paenibacillus apiarius TaxID=46240 RepID=A0ABT4DWC0_9BACL|nr:monodechloroaminopyrrolnitrin synthase PrnB family protein [Paenibacillus apiarius]MCY9517723.1 DUF1864 family protein [Paenibacillus apiarius]MCY9521624.1 DUF1864 family protein [Paenibacillus apiarius]MCY9555302.1 DUF1864 family protein [Paenibacillus apiarius]MCY9561182.1 DUF1864 family protein [Paenibacillus apiarius]MCY9686325.1 DUF1864 family protein [Paenibacillus apiarius]